MERMVGYGRGNNITRLCASNSDNVTYYSALWEFCYVWLYMLM